MTNLSSLLERAAADHPDHPALRLDDLVLTYAQLREAAGRMSALLAAHGVQPGDRVGIMLPNVPAFPISFYGALAAGAVVVPMNPLLKSREVAYYLGDSGARVVLAWHAAAGEAAKGAADAGAQAIAVETADLADLIGDYSPAWSETERQGDDDAVILYTSGTTGQPKGAELTHAGLVRNAELTAQTLLKNNPRRRDDGLPAAVPRLRPDLRAERDRGRGRHADAAAQVRPGEGAGHHRARRGDDLRGRADHVRRDAAPPGGRPGEGRDAAGLRLRRRLAAGGDPARVRGEVRLHDPGGLRAFRDLPGRVVQPPGPGPQAGLDRHPDRGRADAAHRRRGPDRAGRGNRRDRHPRAQRDEGLLEQARGHRRGHEGEGRRVGAGSAPATWPGWTPTATTTSSTGRKT